MLTSPPDLLLLPERAVVPPGILWHELDGRVILLDPQDERYYSLDDVGARMWTAIVEHPDIPAAVEQLLASYEVEEPTLRHDLAALLDQLAAAGLVTLES